MREKPPYLLCGGTVRDRPECLEAADNQPNRFCKRLLGEGPDLGPGNSARQNGTSSHLEEFEQRRSSGKIAVEERVLWEGYTRIWDLILRP